MLARRLRQRPSHSVGFREEQRNRAAALLRAGGQGPGGLVPASNEHREPVRMAGLTGSAASGYRSATTSRGSTFGSTYGWRRARDDSSSVPTATVLGVMPEVRLPCSAFDRCTAPVFAAGLCQRHYYRQSRYGHPGCTRCRLRDVRPSQGLCTPCIRAEFRGYGFEITGEYRSTQHPVNVVCLTCEIPSTKWLANLRRGHGCEGCYASIRAAIGDKTRLTQEQAADILALSNLTLLGTYTTALAPVEALCGGCGEIKLARVGDNHAKLKRGKRVFGCLPCSRRVIAAESRTTLDEAIAQFLAADIEYLDGWVDPQTPVTGRCLICQRAIRPMLRHVRAGHGCPHCNLTGFWSLPRLQRHPEYATRPARVYLVEFTDHDPADTVFHKVGITTVGGKTSDRIHRHTVLDGGKLLGSADGDLITCYYAEQLVRRHVTDRAYRPSEGRIRGGYTECFLPGEPVDLDHWIDQARRELASGSQARPPIEASNRI
jgi:hypothetical protein